MEFSEIIWQQVYPLMAEIDSLELKQLLTEGLKVVFSATG